MTAARPTATGTPPPSGWRGTWGFVRHFLSAYPRRTAAMVALLVASGLAQGVGVVSVLPLLDIAVGETSADGGALRDVVQAVLGVVGAEPTLGPLLVLIVVMMGLRGLLLWFAMQQVGYTVARVAADLRLRLIGALSEARWDHFSSQPSGHVATALSSEANRASWAYKEAVGGMAAAFEMVVNLAVVLVFSWQVGLLAIATGAMVGGVLYGLVRLARRAGDEQTVQMRDLIGRMTELLPALKPVKAMHREEGLLHVLEQGTRAVDRAQRDAVLARESMTAAREPLLVLVMASGLYAALAVADLAFSAVLLLAIVFYRLMTRFGDLQTNYQTALLGESAFWSVMAQVEAAEAAREPTSGTTPAPALADALVLDGVSVSRGGVPVLVDVDLRLPARTLVVLVGASGAGKSTLLDTLAGLHRPDAGNVLVDGTDLRELDLGSWRRRIGYVPQEVVLLHDSVRSNVAFGDDDVTDDDVRRALDDAGAAGFVNSLADGLDHVVGERGSRLSGGQQQRLAIARALVHDPDLLLLDEATSALDAGTERSIAETLLALRERRLVVAIAHRGLLTEVADVVVEVAPGRVALRDTTSGTRR